MNRIMKIIIAFVVVVMFSFAMLGIGVYAAEQGLISFTGDENLKQTEENIKEITSVLSDVNASKREVETELEYVSQENDKLNQTNQELEEEISKKDEKIAQLENNQSEPNPPTNDDLIGAFSKIKADLIHSIINNDLTEDEIEKLIDDIEEKIENLEDELESFEDDIEACFDEHEKDKEKLMQCLENIEV